MARDISSKTAQKQTVLENCIIDVRSPWRCVSFCERSEHVASAASHTVVRNNKVARVGASPQKRVAVLNVLGPPIVSSS